MDYALEEIDSVYDEIVPMLEAHGAEVPSAFRLVRSYDIGFYYKMQDLGFLRIFTAREQSRLVGYLIFIVCPHPHYMHRVVANLNLFFILPEKRGFGREFFKACQDDLFSEGVSAVICSFERGHGFVNTLSDLGYYESETSYVKGALDG